MTKSSTPARLAALASLLAALTLGAAPAAAQHATSTQPHARRTLRSGVYTAEQADRGSEVYAMHCRSCHTPATHTGETFATFWKGKTLADLLTYVREQMPKNDPGGLDPNQYADVVAYLLKMNALPAGTEEIPTDPAALTPIAMDLAPPAPARKPASTPAKGAAKTTPVRKPERE